MGFYISTYMKFYSIVMKEMCTDNSIFEESAQFYDTYAGACVWILFKKEMNFEFKMHRTGFYLRGIRARAKGVFLLPPSLLCLFLALLYKRQSLRLYISLQTGPLFEYYTATVYLIKVRNFCINLTLHFEIRKK